MQRCAQQTRGWQQNLQQQGGRGHAGPTPRWRPLCRDSSSTATSTSTSTASSSHGKTGRPTVVVTRELGKNGKLIAALAQHQVQAIELPLIEHAPGPDRDQLEAVLRAGAFDWVAVTSPEAAAVFLESWKAAGSPQVRVAVVGGGTGEVLQAAGITPAFTATKALGRVLGAQLPTIPGGSGVVLYPASVRAGTELQESLAASGFSVTRLHTYDTVGVTDVPADQLQAALAADAITFGSPSAVKAWVALVGLAAAQRLPAVCIGHTSAKACERAGLTNVRYAEDPGIPGWAECVLDTLKQRT